MLSHSSFAGHQSYICNLWNKIKEIQGRKKQIKAQQNSTFHLSFSIHFLYEQNTFSQSVTQK